MESKVTEGINIIVEQFYQPDYSNPVLNEFMFAYRITIENNNAFPVQLLRRHWFIHDSNTEQKEVEGEGVIGDMPRPAPRAAKVSSAFSPSSNPTSITNIFPDATSSLNWAKCLEPI